MSDSQFSRYWWLQVLIILKCMHGLSTRMLLLLYSAFIYIKRRLVALNSHGYYIADHGKSWNCVFEFLWEPCNMHSLLMKFK